MNAADNMKYLIEFRSGSFFRDLADEHGSSRANARRFDSRQSAENFMRRHEWILFNGGMVVEVPQ